MSLEAKILYVQSVVDKKFRLILNPDWNAENSNHRLAIRNSLSSQFSSYFSREQLAKLNDLTWLPETSDGFISISHCSLLGGFAYSKFKCGFDVEETKRISQKLLKRVCEESEFTECPHAEFLWVAKEAAYKALSQSCANLVISDLSCSDWQSYFENQVYGFRLNSKKTLDFNLNKGFIFSNAQCLYAVYFK